MALERPDVIHAMANIRPTDAQPFVSQSGFNDFVRNGVGDYTLQCTEAISFAESACEANAGANEALKVGALMVQPGILRVTAFDALNNPADVVNLTVIVSQVTSGPPGNVDMPPTPTPISPGGGVDSVFGRTGDVVAEPGDYDSDQVVNVSAVPGGTVTEALDNLAAVIPPPALAPYTEVYTAPGAHASTVPAGYRLAGAWMAPGAGGGGGGGAGGTGHTAGASGGGGSGGGGGQGGGGTQLQHIVLNIPAGNDLTITVGAGGVGGTGTGPTAPGGVATPGGAGGLGGDSFISGSLAGDIARAQAQSVTTQAQGRGTGGAGGLNGTALAGGAARNLNGDARGYAWPWYLSYPSDLPSWGGVAGQASESSGAGGAPGVDGVTSTDGHAVGTNAMIMLGGTAINTTPGAAGGAQQGGVHGGGGAGGPGGSGGLGWEWNSPAGIPISSLVGRGGAAAAGAAGNATNGGNGGQGADGNQGTLGRGGGGGGGGGASGHAGVLLGTGGGGGNGGQGSAGCVILEFEPI